MAPKAKSKATKNGESKKKPNKTAEKASEKTDKKPVRSTRRDVASSNDANADHRDNSLVDANEENASQGSLDVAACCLCHCALDYSDKAAFFQSDRHEDYSSENDSADEYYFRPTDPYLPADLLYDKHNALVYCDCCDRLYHQKCHFVPLAVLPRGDWQCLFCVSTTKAPAGKRKSKSNKKASNVVDAPDIRTLKPIHISEADKAKMFISPPPPAHSAAAVKAKQLEQAWEYDSRIYKAYTLYHEVYTRLPNLVKSQLANARLAETALETLTSTQKNRAHFMSATSRNSSRTSQELAQTLVKLFTSQVKIREWMYNIDQIRLSKCIISSAPTVNGVEYDRASPYDMLVKWLSEQKDIDDFVGRVIFPFGIIEPRRVPLTAEAVQAQVSNNNSEMRAAAEDTDVNNVHEVSIPQEITVSSKDRNIDENEDHDLVIRTRSSDKHDVKQTTAATHTANKNKDKDKSESKQAKDDDSGVSLAELRCCVCFNNESTDENDMILCDGQCCYRAYHMQCIGPAVTTAELEASEDWFCPLCSGTATLLIQIQTKYMGDDWERRRLELQYSKKKHATTDSLKSWEQVDDVFAMAETHYNAAIQLKQGKKNKETDTLVAMALGVDVGEIKGSHDSDNDDDDEDDEHFDLEHYNEERERMRQKDGDGNKTDNDDEESSHSSQATLVDMSSVEINVDKDELAALSEVEESDSDDTNDDGGAIRRSKRLRNFQDESKSNDDDIGELNETNIVHSKRGRKPVDYIKLNEAIFGDTKDVDLHSLDDADEYKGAEKPKKRKTRDDNDESDSDNENEEESNNEDVNDNEKSNKEELSPDTDTMSLGRQSSQRVQSDNTTKLENDSNVGTFDSRRQSGKIVPVSSSQEDRIEAASSVDIEPEIASETTTDGLDILTQQYRKKRNMDTGHKSIAQRVGKRKKTTPKRLQ